jgi:hypothetical protein
VTVSGHAELTTEGAWEHIDKLSARYHDEPVYRYRGVQRVIVRVRVGPKNSVCGESGERPEA